MLSFRAVAQTGIPVPAFVPFERSLQQFMQRWQIPGASVAFGGQGRLVYARAFGYADLARTEPLQPYHLLRVASVAKPVTAMAVMRLVEQGRLALAGKAFGPQGYLRSAYYTGAIADPRLYDVTVQQLLEHTAGWDRSIGCAGHSTCDPIDFPWQVAQAMHAPAPVADSTLVRFMLGQGLNFAPGARYPYSNVGYLVLGKIVEAVTGQPYEAWVRDNLFGPAGALEAHLGRNLPAGRLEREVEYDSRSEMLACDGSGQTVPAAYGGFNLEAMGPHGGWVSSARALVRLVLATEGDIGRGLLTTATRAAMAQPSAANPGYAKGWQVNAAGHRWHGGSLDGTAAYLVRTAGDYTWAILLNAQPNDPAFWDELDRLGWTAVPGAAAWPTYSLLAPARNATALTAADDAGRTLLQWAPGSGTRRLVLVRPDAPVDAFPADGTRYAAGQDLGRGTFVAADAAGNSARVDHLDPYRRYYVRVVEYADNAATGHHPVYLLDGNPTLALHAPEGVVAAAHATDLQLYPSPAHNEVAVAGVARSLPYEVSTVQGRRVRGGLLAPGSTISVADLPAGTYLVRFQVSDGNVFRRFVKE